MNRQNDKKIKELELLNKILLEKVAEYEVYQKSLMVTTLRSYGKENLDYLSDISYINLMKYPTLGMIELIRIIYYNDKHPENKIIAITGEDQIIKIKDEDEWLDINLNDFVYPFINRIFEMMDKYYHKNVKGLEHMADIENRFENLRYRIDNKDKNCLKFFNNQFKMLVYRNKKN